MNNSKRNKSFLLAIALGVGLFATDVLAYNLITICYRTRTIEVPDYLYPRYITAGATDGACPVTP